MTQSAIATAADYADAMITARKAKNILFVIILLMLLGEISLFFAFRHGLSDRRIDGFKYLIGLIDFLGVALPIVLSIDLLLLAAIMLVGRLIGVSRVVAAFLWCVVLAVILFPWQAFLINQTFTSTEFKVPGVLYTWAELTARASVHPDGPWKTILFWARFVGFPVVAVIILLIIQFSSRHGLRLALGETAADSIQPSPDA
jgi:hypothetical protein